MQIKYFEKYFPLLIGLAFLPYVILITFATLQFQSLSKLREEIRELVESNHNKASTRELKDNFFKKYKTCPHFFEKNLENLSFLRKDIQFLEKIKGTPLWELSGLDDRLKALKSEENKLSFAEDEIQSKKGITESVERQVHPIALDEHDLKKLLSILDNIPIENFLPPLYSPQIWIKDFHLSKMKSSNEKSENFNLEMVLIKREF